MFLIRAAANICPELTHTGLERRVVLRAAFPLSIFIAEILFDIFRLDRRGISARRSLTAAKIISAIHTFFQLHPAAAFLASDLTLSIGSKGFVSS